jgi:putative radical SAM enzyme (TIGR03279 family)
MARETCGKITEVVTGSPADHAGIRPGDELMAINGQAVQDLLDYRYLTAEDRLVIEVLRDGERRIFHIARNEGEYVGLMFEDDLFDGVHTCANSCIFCFLHQMPKGLRSSLYVRDDDFRLSFAHGNYITLTNLTDREMERICSQRMSPLYISAHATEPDLRAYMLGNKKAGRVMEQMRRLADARIAMHAQIVLCPGINDGEHLERTVRDLASLHPWVKSVAVVPVGLTKHRAGLIPLRPVDSKSAWCVLDSITRLQDEFPPVLGTRLVFASDEFYLTVGRDFPRHKTYEGFPQLEDGIGLSRLFLDELSRVRRRIVSKALRPGRYVLITGTLAAGMVKEFADALSACEDVNARLCIIKNKFLGETITVSGLMAGRDIVEVVKHAEEDEEVLIPKVALNEGRFVDDMTISELDAGVRAKVRAVPTSPLELVKLLRS